MDIFKDKKIIGIAVLMIIVLGVSLFTYGKNKNKVFKDEYMKDIFVEENEKNTESSSEAMVETAESTTTSSGPLIVVEIKGEVKNPDVYQLSGESIVKDLIDMAGGLTDKADISGINRAEKLQNHQLVIIKNINDINLPQNSNIINSANNSISNNNEKIININTATLEELKDIPGIGDVKAQSIIDYRDKNNGFKKVEELKNIDGIGEKTFQKIKNKVIL